MLIITGYYSFTFPASPPISPIAEQSTVTRYLPSSGGAQSRWTWGEGRGEFPGNDAVGVRFGRAQRRRYLTRTVYL